MKYDGKRSLPIQGTIFKNRILVTFGYVKMKLFLNACCLLTALVFSQGAFAQDTAVRSQLVAQRIDKVEGKDVLTSATEGKPGDILQYSGTYRNTGAAAANKLVATIPVPLGTTLIADSVEPLPDQASIDGTRFGPAPLMRIVKQADGSERTVAVPMSQYRALRWDVGTLAGGASTVVKLQVRIDAPFAKP